MRVLIDGQVVLYGENVKLVRTLMKRESPDEYPELLKWALQMLYFDGDDWVEICRIDNFPHNNRVGSHIHIPPDRKERRMKISFRDAERMIKERSVRILRERYHEEIDFWG